MIHIDNVIVIIVSVLLWFCRMQSVLWCLSIMQELHLNAYHVCCYDAVRYHCGMHYAVTRPADSTGKGNLTLPYLTLPYPTLPCPTLLYLTLPYSTGKDNGHLN